mgnify:CR=1 FL=1
MMYHIIIHMFTYLELQSKRQNLLEDKWGLVSWVFNNTPWVYMYLPRWVWSMYLDVKVDFYTMRRNANARRGRGVGVHVTWVNYSIIIHVIY